VESIVLCRQTVGKEIYLTMFMVCFIVVVVYIQRYIYALFNLLPLSLYNKGPGGCDDDTAILMEGSTTEVHVLPEGLLCETDVSFFFFLV